MTFRPGEIPPAEVVVRIGWRRNWPLVPTPELADLSFHARPRPVNGLSTLQFKTRTFIPPELQLNADNRDLRLLLRRNQGKSCTVGCVVSFITLDEGLLTIVQCYIAALTLA